eukprot:ANDGO_02999.mRNA.1 4-chlorobenzoyl coenzyme A dehalogenase-1
MSGKGWESEISLAQSRVCVLPSGVLVLTLARERVQNAFSDRLCDEIVAVLTHCGADDRIRSVLLTADGDSFSTGYDIKDFMRSQANPPVDMRTLGVGRFFSCLWNFQKPVIAAVNGPAIGMAVTLLAFCEYAVCTTTARFQTPFLQLSLVPEGCSTLLFPRLIGQRKATEMLILGRSFNAQQSVECGLVNEVVTSQQSLMERATKVAEEFAALDPVAMRKSKKLMLDALSTEQLRVTFERELFDFAAQLRSPECIGKFQQFMTRKSKL